MTNPSLNQLDTVSNQSQSLNQAKTKDGLPKRSCTSYSTDYPMPRSSPHMFSTLTTMTDNQETILKIMQRPHIWANSVLFLIHPSDAKLSAILVHDRNKYTFYYNSEENLEAIKYEKGKEELLHKIIEQGWIIDSTR